LIENNWVNGGTLPIILANPYLEAGCVGVAVGLIIVVVCLAVALMTPTRNDSVERKAEKWYNLVHSVRFGKHSVVAQAVRAAKLRFGCPKRTKANAMVIQDFLNKWFDTNYINPTLQTTSQLRGQSMRKSDVQYHLFKTLPIAVELVFLPSETETLAHRLRKSQFFSEKLEEFEGFPDA
jgi:hypothetical protein